MGIKELIEDIKHDYKVFFTPMPEEAIRASEEYRARFVIKSEDDNEN